MNIRINETPVDFTLEHETTFAHLFQALSQWAKSERLEVLSVLADGKALAADAADPLAGIGTVDVETVPETEGTMAHLDVVSRFFVLAANAEGGQLEELRGQYESFRPVLTRLLAPVTHRLSQELAVLDGPWSGADVGPAALRLASEAAGLRDELADPGSALSDAIGELEAALPGEELARLFQKGDDRDGFERILKLFTAFEDLSRRAELALDRAGADGTAWTAFQDDLRPFLGEARDALEAADQILLTDLLEYEIVPRLSSVRACFSNLDPASRRT